MRVESIVAIGHVVDFRWEVGRDQRRDTVKSESYEPIVDRRAILGPRVAHQLLGIERAARYAVDELLGFVIPLVAHRNRLKHLFLIRKSRTDEFLRIVEHERYVA